MIYCTHGMGIEVLRDLNYSLSSVVFGPMLSSTPAIKILGPDGPEIKIQVPEDPNFSAGILIISFD